MFSEWGVNISVCLARSRLYILQGALAQQEWRVPVLLHNLSQYLRSHLAHLYKNVRDRIGRYYSMSYFISAASEKYLSRSQY